MPWRMSPPADTVLETQLIAKAKGGDRPAFDLLLRPYVAHLRGFLARRVGTHSAEDVTQETLLACWTALPNYAARSRFRVWLYGIATNKALSYLRHSQRERQEETLSESLASDDKYSAVELRAAVAAALETLPLEQRDVIELYYFAEMNLPEIAQALPRNLNTVKYQFYQAHARIAKVLEVPEE